MIPFAKAEKGLGSIVRVTLQVNENPRRGIAVPKF